MLKNVTLGAFFGGIIGCLFAVLVGGLTAALCDGAATGFIDGMVSPGLTRIAPWASGVCAGFVALMAVVYTRPESAA